MAKKYSVLQQAFRFWFSMHLRCSVFLPLRLFTVKQKVWNGQCYKPFQWHYWHTFLHSFFIRFLNNKKWTIHLYYNMWLSDFWFWHLYMLLSVNFLKRFPRKVKGKTVIRIVGVLDLIICECLKLLFFFGNDIIVFLSNLKKIKCH